MFVAVSNDNAGKPGAAQRIVKLQSVKGAQAAGTTPAVAGPNDGLFDSPASGGIVLDITGPTEAVKANFKGGQKWIVTFTPLPES